MAAETDVARFVGESDSDFAGSGVALGGDVDGDGQDDLVIGAYYADEMGRCYLFYGGTSPTGEIDLGTADFVFEGEAAGDYTGYSVGLDDLNGDGDADILVGGFGADSGAGTLYAVFGE